MKVTSMFDTLLCWQKKEFLLRTSESLMSASERNIWKQMMIDHSCIETLVHAHINNHQLKMVKMHDAKHLFLIIYTVKAWEGHRMNMASGHRCVFNIMKAIMTLNSSDGLLSNYHHK
eukprot:880275_1